MAPFTIYDPMDDVVTFGVLDQHYGSFTDILILPWTKYDNVTKMHDERVHAVALGRQFDCTAFRYQSPDLFHHNFRVYNYRAHVVQKYG